MSAKPGRTFGGGFKAALCCCSAWSQSEPTTLVWRLSRSPCSSAKGKLFHISTRNERASNKSFTHVDQTHTNTRELILYVFGIWLCLFAKSPGATAANVHCIRFSCGYGYSDTPSPNQTHSKNVYKQAITTRLTKTKLVPDVCEKDTMCVSYLRVNTTPHLEVL